MYMKSTAEVPPGGIGSDNAAGAEPKWTGDGDDPPLGRGRGSDKIKNPRVRSCIDSSRHRRPLPHAVHTRKVRSKVSRVAESRIRSPTICVATGWDLAWKRVLRYIDA